MRFRKGLLGIAGLAAATALALTPAAASAAGGPGNGNGNGGGAGHGAGGGGVGQGGPGKGGPPTTESANNLSVPTVFVGGTGDFTLQNTTGDLVMPDDVPPTLVTTTPVDIPPGYFYIQGVNTWQATYTKAGAATATAAWGENLATGSASLKAGHPVRVEMSLTNAIVDGTAVTGTGFSVYKLDESVADRLSPYGTPALSSTGPGIAVPDMPARVWGPGAMLSITAPDGQTEDVPMPGEINATGAIVFGYNWRPSEPGGYTLTFKPPAGVAIANPDNLSIKADVTSSGGGGGGGGPH